MNPLRPESKPDGRVLRAERLRTARRNQVLAAARRLFAERGYHATSVHDIIAAADIARGTFYLYFESKRAIFDELLDDFFVTLAANVRRVDTDPAARPPLDQLHEMMMRIFAVLENERPMARIVLREAVGLDVDVDKKLADFYDRIVDLIERALRAGMELGLVRRCDARLTAWAVIGSVKEVCDRVFVLGAPAPDLGALGRQLVDFALRGVFASA